MAAPDFISYEDMEKLKPQAAPSKSDSKSPDFISYEDMQKIQQPSLFERSKGYIKGGLQALPTAGGIAGGLLGAGAGGIGALPGAVAGGAAGRILQNLGESYILDEPKTRAEIYGGPIASGLEMGTAELGGQVIGKGLGLLGSKIGSALKPEAGLITKAAEDLGAKPTAGMLSRDPVVQGMESSLAQSPTMAGQSVRNSINQARQPMMSAASNLTKEATNLDKGEIGDVVKSGITSNIGERLDKPASIYDSLRTDFQNIDINPKSLERVGKNMVSTDAAQFETGGGKALSKSLANDFQSIKNVDQLRRLKTTIGKSFEQANIAGDKVASEVYGNAYTKLKNLEQSTIMRQAIEQARTPGEGAGIAKNMITELKTANKDYALLRKDISETSRRAGLGNQVKSIDGFLTRLEQTPSEKIPNKLFNTQDYESLNFMKDKFPEQFEALRSLKLKDIMEKSQIKGQPSVTKLLSATKDLDQRTVKLVFGDDGPKVLQSLKTLENSTPNIMGPSRTPQGILYNMKSFVSPSHWLNELKDAARLAELRLKDPRSAPILQPSGLLNKSLSQAPKGLMPKTQLPQEGQ